MNYSQLKYIIEVEKANNFTKAANNLFIAQPSLSQQIISLENELGIQIFNRENRKKLEITPEGEIVISYAKEVLQLTENLHNQLQNFQKYGAIRIGLLLSFGYSKINQTLNKFRKENENTILKYKVDISKKLMVSLLNNEVDVIFITEKENELNNVYKDTFTYQLVSESQLTLIVNKHHSLAKKKTITANDLNQQNILMVSQDSYCWKDLNNIFINHKVTPNFIGESSQTDIIIQIAQDNLGVGFLSQESFENFNGNTDHIVSIPIQPIINRSIYLVYKKDHPNIETITHLKKYFVQ